MSHGSISIYNICCCCNSGHQSVRCVWIMKRWGSKPWTGTDLCLGSVAIVKFFIEVSSCLTCFNRFWIFYVSLLCTTIPSSVTFVLHRISLCNTHSPPPILSQNAVHLDVSYICHPPASATIIYAPHYVPASASVYCIRLPPPFHPRHAPRSLLSPVGFACIWVPPSSLCLYFALPVICSNYWYLLVLCVFVGWPSFRKGKGRVCFPPLYYHPLISNLCSS